ncbi:MAG: ArnT family glycosyltransferase [Actinomycetota bacterium]
MRLAAAALLTTVVPTAVGFLLVRGGHIALRLGLGGVLGIAILGLGAMLGGLAGSFEAGAAISMIATLVWARSQRRPARSVDGSPPVLPILLVVVVGMFLLVISWSRPVSRFDGWAFWSLKAKAIASTGDFSSPIFTDAEYEYSHRDYPPLLPAWQALSYRISGDLTVGHPTQFQLAWLWTCAGLAVVGLAGRRRSLAGFALFAWLLAPQVVEEAVSGYADVPMALFLIVGMVALLRSEELGVAVGAILVAAAAVTKAEGLVFAVAAIVPFLVVARYRLRAMVAAAAIILAFGPWFAFTQSHGLTGDVTRPPLEAGHIDPERDPVERVPTVLEGLGRYGIKPTDWGILGPVAILAIGLSRFRPIPLIAAALLSVVAWVVVYLGTPFEVGWHLSTSADRVLIAPLGLLALAAGGAELLTREDEAIPAP